MGRPRKHPSQLPPSVVESHGAYFHIVKNVWNPLGRNLAEALRLYGERIRPTAEGGLNPLIDACFMRMKARKVEPLAKNTVRQYTSAAKILKHLLRKFASPQQVKQRDAAQVKMLLAGTPNMANRVMSFGRSVFADLLEQQAIDSNPFVGVRRLKEGKRTRLYTWAEWNAIYAHAGPRLKVIMDLLFLTDQRIDDVLSIDERDLLDNGIRFTQQKTDTKIIVAWNDQLRETVARARGLHGKVVMVNFEVKDRPRPLIRTRKGRRPAYGTIRADWVKATTAAGVEDAHMHDGRAFSATENDKQHGRATAQAALGHVTEANTGRYLRDREAKVVRGPTKRTA